MRISTGIEGLDRILHGGLLSGRVYLVHGEPGTGKTTLGLHFLSAGETGLLITFAQPAEQIRTDARERHLNLEHVTILDLTPAPDVFAEVQTYDIFLPSEVERDPISQQIARAISGMWPRRIFVDTFDQFRSLATNPLQYRRFAQSFFRYATREGATVILGGEDPECASLSDGVIELQAADERRSLRVTKFRGSDYRLGSHAMRLTAKGIEVPFEPEEGGRRAK
jgi:circadian clock protein KaiC